MSKKIDMTGITTENGIYVIEEAPKKQKEIMWRCICPQCLREDWLVRGTKLRNNEVKVCKQCSSLNNLKQIKTPYFKNLKNQRFGKLIAIEPTKERLGSLVVWKCQCDCGEICFKASSYLINGDTQSCGCLCHSKGEERIETILKQNNIVFEKEKIFPQLSLLRFDFYIDNNYVIEFDGRQHFQYSDTGYGKDIEKIHKRDLEKNNYCFKNNIPIIRIPYTAIEQINYEELNLNTSNFILTKENENEYYRCM